MKATYKQLRGMSRILSKREPEEFPLNLPAPSGKAKYDQETDSELVL